MWTCSRASAEHVGTEGCPQLRQKWESTPKQKSLTPGLLEIAVCRQWLSGKTTQWSVCYENSTTSYGYHTKVPLRSTKRR